MENASSLTVVCQDLVLTARGAYLFLLSASFHTLFRQKDLDSKDSCDLMRCSEKECPLEHASHACDYRDCHADIRLSPASKTRRVKIRILSLDTYEVAATAMEVISSDEMAKR